LQGLAVSAQGLALDREAQILYRVEAEGSVVSYPVQAIAGVIPREPTFGVNDQGYPVILDGEARPLRVWDEATQDWRLNVDLTAPQSLDTMTNLLRTDEAGRRADLRQIARAMQADERFWERRVNVKGQRDYGAFYLLTDGTILDDPGFPFYRIMGGGDTPRPLVFSRFNEDAYLVTLPVEDHRYEAVIGRPLRYSLHLVMSQAYYDYITTRITGWAQSPLAVSLGRYPESLANPADWWFGYMIYTGQKEAAGLPLFTGLWADLGSDGQSPDPAWALALADLLGGRIDDPDRLAEVVAWLEGAALPGDFDIIWPPSEHGDEPPPVP
jgi:hypothetical protein